MGINLVNGIHVNVISGTASCSFGNTVLVELNSNSKGKSLTGASYSDFGYINYLTIPGTLPDTGKEAE